MIMTLPHKDFRELVELLTHFYGFENEAGRRTTLLNSGLDTLIPQLDLSFKTADFIPLLLERLDHYGLFEGVPAVVHLLEYIAPQVGEDKRATLQQIIEKIAPPRSSNRITQTPEPAQAENGNLPPLWDVFICYAKEDLKTAKRLYDDLERAGIAVWLNKKKLVVGQNWKLEIKKAMQHSRYILTLLSSHSVSKSGYVQEELREALDMQARMPLDQIRIIPVRLDECDPTHEQLRDLHWLDLFESYEEGLQQILQLFPTLPDTNRISVEARSPRPLEDSTTVEINAATKTDAPCGETGAATAPLRNITIDLPGNVKMELIAIPGGTFWMGSKDGEGEKYERPRHQVTVAPFYIGKYPVTQAQWQAVMKNNPSKFKGADRPVEQVPWNDCQKFVNKLNATVGAGSEPAPTFRLPSEAEWEYACRAGTETAYSFGDDPAQLGEYAWFDGNSGGGTYPVGQKQPNTWGVYDMLGNVYEWCEDAWHDNYTGAPTDGSAWTGGDDGWHVLRGGSWWNSTKQLRCAYRDWYLRPLGRNYNYGFRVVLVRSGMLTVSPF